MTEKGPLSELDENDNFLNLTFNLKKFPRKGLGITVSGSESGFDGVFIAEIPVYSPIRGILEPGDQIIKVDGFHIYRQYFSDEDALRVLQTRLLDDSISVRLTVRRIISLPPYAVATPGEGENMDGHEFEDIVVSQGIHCVPGAFLGDIKHQQKHQERWNKQTLKSQSTINSTISSTQPPAIFSQMQKSTTSTPQRPKGAMETEDASPSSGFGETNLFNDDDMSIASLVNSPGARLKRPHFGGKLVHMYRTRESGELPQFPPVQDQQQTDMDTSLHYAMVNVSTNSIRGWQGAKQLLHGDSGDLQHQKKGDGWSSLNSSDFGGTYCSSPLDKSCNTKPPMNVNPHTVVEQKRMFEPIVFLSSPKQTTNNAPLEDEKKKTLVAPTVAIINSTTNDGDDAMVGETTKLNFDGDQSDHCQRCFVVQKMYNMEACSFHFKPKDLHDVSKEDMLSMAKMEEMNRFRTVEDSEAETYNNGMSRSLMSSSTLPPSLSYLNNFSNNFTSENSMRTVKSTGDLQNQSKLQMQNSGGVRVKSRTSKSNNNSQLSPSTTQQQQFQLQSMDEVQLRRRKSKSKGGRNGGLKVPPHAKDGSVRSRRTSATLFVETENFESPCLHVDLDGVSVNSTLEALSHQSSPAEEEHDGTTHFPATTSTDDDDNSNHGAEVNDSTTGKDSIDVTSVANYLGQSSATNVNNNDVEKHGNHSNERMKSGNEDGVKSENNHNNGSHKQSLSQPPSPAVGGLVMATPTLQRTLKAGLSPEGETSEIFSSGSFFSQLNFVDVENNEEEDVGNIVLESKELPVCLTTPFTTPHVGERSPLPSFSHQNRTTFFSMTPGEKRGSHSSLFIKSDFNGNKRSSNNNNNNTSKTKLRRISSVFARKSNNENSTHFLHERQATKDGSSRNRDNSMEKEGGGKKKTKGKKEQKNQLKRGLNDSTDDGLVSWLDVLSIKDANASTRKKYGFMMNNNERKNNTSSIEEPANAENGTNMDTFFTKDQSAATKEMDHHDESDCKQEDNKLNSEVKEGLTEDSLDVAKLFTTTPLDVSLISLDQSFANTTHNNDNYNNIDGTDSTVCDNNNRDSANIIASNSQSAEARLLQRTLSVNSSTTSSIYERTWC
eukprot:m.136586 g.136586  ORF g.136586 m.136586 type:complete len:1112 (+) comp13143_c0_seq4:80-3415(+)